MYDLDIKRGRTGHNGTKKALGSSKYMEKKSLPEVFIPGILDLQGLTVQALFSRWAKRSRISAA